MEITILGSGNCMPSMRRNPPGYLFKIKGKNLVFDLASGSLNSLLKFNINYNTVDYVFITHQHYDHIADSIALFAVCRHNRKTDLNVIGFKGIKKFFKNIFKIIPDIEPKVYKINWTEMDDSQINIDDIKISPNTP